MNWLTKLFCTCSFWILFVRTEVRPLYLRRRRRSAPPTNRRPLSTARAARHASVTNVHCGARSIETTPSNHWRCFTRNTRRLCRQRYEWHSLCLLFKLWIIHICGSVLWIIQKFFWINVYTVHMVVGIVVSCAHIRVVWLRSVSGVLMWPQTLI